MQTLNIGRDAGNQIVLNDKMVSRRHAQLNILDNGQIMIKDLDSANGTFVNGNRVKESYLNSGDIVKCGTVFLNWNQYINQSAEIPQNQYSAEANSVNLVAVANKMQEWDSKFVSFIKPFLGTIDSGLFFRRVLGWAYTAIAVLNILIPIYILFKAIDSGVFKSDGKIVLATLLVWLVLALLCWFGFQLWWNRKEKVNQSSYDGAEFVATPVLAHFIQTFGEWIGIITGVLGFVYGLLSLLFTNSSTGPNYMNGDEWQIIPIDFGINWNLIFVGPIIGFLIVFLFRFFAESIKAVSVIANNTRNK